MPILSSVFNSPLTFSHLQNCELLFEKPGLLRTTILQATLGYAGVISLRMPRFRLELIQAISSTSPALLLYQRFKTKVNRVLASSSRLSCVKPGHLLLMYSPLKVEILCL